MAARGPVSDVWALMAERSRWEVILLALAGSAGLGGGVVLLTTEGGPPWLRLSAAAFIIFVWPGWALVATIRPCTPLPPLERIALAISSSAIPLAAEAIVAYMLHPAMETMLWVHLAAMAVLTVGAALRTTGWDNGREPSADETSGGWAALAVALVFAVVLFRLAPAYGPDLRSGVDSWFHLGYMSYHSEGSRVTSSCAFFTGAPPDPRYPYSASHFSLAALTAAARLPVLQVWSFLAPALSLAMVLAAFLFVRRVFAHSGLAVAAMVLVMVGMLMPESEPIRSLSFKVSASPAVALRYPYPYSMATRVLLPALLGLVAAYIGQPRRWILALIGGLAFAAPAFHVSQLLYLPLLSAALVLTAAAVCHGDVRAPLRTASVMLFALSPYALAISSSYAVNHVFADLAASASTIHSLPSRNLFLVAPEGMLFPWMLGAIAVAGIALLDSRVGNSGLVAGAIIILVPAVNLNPILAPILSRYATVALLSRLYYPPPSHLHFAGIFLVPAVIAARILEGSIGLSLLRRRSVLLRVAALIAGAVAFGLLILTGVTVFASGMAHLHSRVGSSLALTLVVAVLALALIPLGRLARSRDWRLLPERPSGGAALLAIVAVICGVLVAQAIAGRHAAGVHVRNDLSRRWSVNPSTGAPRFLEAIAADAPPYTAVVYANDPFAAEIAPAFALQHVLFYKMNANPAVDIQSRARDWGLLGNPEAALEARQDALERRQVGYVVLTRAAPDTVAAVSELMAGQPPMHHDAHAIVWRIRQ